MIKASAILTSYNNAHNLEACLESLMNQDYDKGSIDLELIIVESGSMDNSIEILKRYESKIKIILKPPYLPRLSPAEARNLGVQNSKGDILIFSDSDCVLPFNWVKDMVASFNNPQIDCVIGNREPDIGKGWGTFVRRYDFILYSNKFRISKPLTINIESLQKDTPFVLLAGNNFAIKKEVWNQFQGMKTIFKNPAGEDVMLEIELLKANYSILFNPHLKVSHNHPVSLGKLFKRAFQNGEATYLLSKYSNGFVNWKHFAERGHIFNFRSFSLSIFFIAIFFIFFYSKFSFIARLISLLVLFFIFIVWNLIATKQRLDLTLSLKKGHKKTYQLSLFKIFCFNQIHFCLKGIALINFLWCTLIKK